MSDRNSNSDSTATEQLDSDSDRPMKANGTTIETDSSDDRTPGANKMQQLDDHLETAHSATSFADRRVTR